MPTTDVIILGGEGNGDVIAAAIEDAVRRGALDARVLGFLNDRVSLGELIAGRPCLGGLDAVRDFLGHGCYFIDAIFRIDGHAERIARFEALSIPPERLFPFIHPLAYVAPGVILAPGCAILPQAAISPGARLGLNCLVMCGATIGHDTVLGDYCHLAAQACLSSSVRLGRGVHIGLNATVRENLSIGDGATLGMGAVLLNDIGPGEIWAGNPARFLRNAE
jgi:sugar O-acyltransferase (sialic acid O-acetyltransferase NeuD family)